ncbi:MAG: hypothetical protein PVS2B2_10140 [Candidatus Acidiferrum sp.]
MIPVVTVLVCGAAGLVASLVMPKKFTSSTMVLVEQPAVSADYVKPVMAEDLNRRLGSMKEQVLSGSRLQPIIEKLNLYPQQRQKDHMEILVAQLRKSVEVELMQPMAGSVNRQPPGFHVSVTFDNPQVAQQICGELTSMFMEQNATIRIKQAADTTQFLSQQLDDAKVKLDEQDAKLAQFKRQYLGSLPEESQTNLNLLTGMNTQLEAATQALSRAHQDKAFNETMLSQQLTSFQSATSNNISPENQEQQLSILQTQLADLLSRYTPEHPDVIKMKSQIEELKKRLAQEPAPKSPGSTEQSKLREPASVQQLRAKVKQDELNIADLTKRQSQIQEQTRQLQGRVQASPMVEQQFKELTRNYQTASEIYNDLLKKRESSAMSTELESKQESETFRVLDAPSLPTTPSSPNRLLLVGGGFAGGFVLALGILYALAMMDKGMYTEHDVEKCLKLPVLVRVPSFQVRLTEQDS